jgi:hypothetical protein
MGVSEKILLEIEKYNKINKYISEQEAPADIPPPPPAGDLPPAPDAGATPPPPAEGGAETPTTTEPQPVDVASDPDVEKVGEEKEEENTEELEITDLVKSQKNIEDKQTEYFENLFSQLSNLEDKLKDMDSVMERLNSIESKIENYRPKSAQEKLELRSLDSGPFNQKLTDFFTDKQEDIKKTGKNEYVLTTDDVEDFSPSDIKNTFTQYGDNNEYMSIKN